MSKEIAWLNLQSKGFILLSGNVIEVMEGFRQTTPLATEAGGVLLGERRGPHLQVTELTMPYPGDVRKRRYFDRRDSRHNKYAYKRWVASNRKVGYLGEWHTHPEQLPTPSSLDLCEWQRVVKLHRQSMIFIIMGTEDIWLGLGRKQSILKCANHMDMNECNKVGV